MFSKKPQKSSYIWATFLYPLVPTLMKPVLTCLNRFSFQVDGDGEMFVSVAEIFVHPSYNPATLDSDYSILRLAGPVAKSPEVGYVCLPRISEQLHIVGTGFRDQYWKPLYRNLWPALYLPTYILRCKQYLPTYEMEKLYLPNRLCQQSHKFK